MLLSKGIDSVSREQINDFAMISEIQKAKAAIPTKVAKTWLEMHEKGCLPRWAIQQVNIEVMRKAAL